MGQQHRVTAKRRRRGAYLERKKAQAKSGAAAAKTSAAKTKAKKQPAAVAAS